MNVEAKIPLEEPRESPTGNTTLTSFTDCPARFAFKYLLNWLPERESLTKDYLVFGQAVHLFKEHFYNGEDIEKARFDGLKYLNQFPELTSDVIKSLELRYNRAVNEWLKHFGDDLVKYRIIGAEIPLTVTLENGFKISVRLDCLVQHRETGLYYIIDTKTTKGSLVDMLEKYRYGPQPFIYCLAIKQSNFKWKDDFRGWLTDVIGQRHYKNMGWKTEVKRSEVVFYTEANLREYSKSLTLLTDEIAFCTRCFVNDQKSLGESFRRDRNKCHQRFNGLCPYFYDCLKEHYFTDPVPSAYSKDTWPGYQSLLKNLTAIFQNDKKIEPELGL